jgi:hypothetical protein
MVAHHPGRSARRGYRAFPLAAVAVVLFGLILLSLGRIVARGEIGAIVATHKRSN